MNAGFAGKTEIPWERVSYLSALEVRSRWGAIQIHVYLYLPRDALELLPVHVLPVRDCQVFPRDALELLPVHNKTSTQHYVAAERAADWSEPSGLGRL